MSKKTAYEFLEHCYNEYVAADLCNFFSGAQLTEYCEWLSEEIGVKFPLGSDE